MAAFCSGKATIMTTPKIETAPDLKLSAKDIEAVAGELERYFESYSPLFHRREAREAGLVYLRGLLSNLPRKSVEPIALELRANETSPVRTLQLFLSVGAWDDGPILARHWQQVDAMLGEREGVLVLDGSDFPKQGKESVGVKRQHCGELGKRANCQAGVFLAYTSRGGYTLVDRRLYLPEDWATSEEFAARRKRCGVPTDHPFKTKPELGAEMIEAVVADGHLRCQWVTADEAFGHDTGLLDRIAKTGLWYFAEVQHSDRVWLERPEVVPPNWEGRPRPHRKQTRPRLAAGEAQAQTVAAIAEQTPKRRWKRLLIKEGSKGPMEADFVALRCVAVRSGLPGPDVWLVLRRRITDGGLKAYVSNAPATTSTQTFARISGMRWPIETSFEDGKQRLGMGDYEVRTWKGWHHHMTMVILAHALLVRLRLRLGKKSTGADTATGTADPERGTASARAKARGRHRSSRLHAAAQPRRLPLTS
jgi:SRSO17 transposase